MLSNQTAKIHGKTTRDVHLQLIAAKYLVKDVKFGLLLFLVSVVGLALGMYAKPVCFANLISQLIILPSRQKYHF